MEEEGVGIRWVKGEYLMRGQILVEPEASPSTSPPPPSRRVRMRTAPSAQLPPGCDAQTPRGRHDAAGKRAAVRGACRLHGKDTLKGGAAWVLPLLW
eukprot:355368-Chlamydomonas_euryale.AAC.16